MNKKFAPMMEAVRFEAEDVIATSVVATPCPNPDVPHLYLGPANENGVMSGTYYGQGVNGRGEAVTKGPNDFQWGIELGDTSVGNWYYAYDTVTKKWYLDSHTHTS